MGYYIRVLSKTSVFIPLETLQKDAVPGVLTVVQGESQDWQTLSLTHASGEEIAIIEKNPVLEGELGYEELAEFQEEVRELQPQSGAAWLINYLASIQVIYAFQLLDGTDINDGWSILHSVHSAIWRLTGGILQSDGEGFSNEDGYTIVWQFSDSVTGDWKVGVLIPGEGWVHYTIDLGNLDHRQAFRSGKIPVGVERI